MAAPLHKGPARKVPHKEGFTVKRLLLSSMVAVTAFGLAGCGGSNECQLGDPKGCPSDQICEAVQGQEQGACFAPVELRGKVFDLDSAKAIAGAQVTALDENGSPVSTVATSDDAGNYTLRIPTNRADDKGAPIGRKVTLRASARDYQTFPSGLRVSLPIDTTAVAQEKEGEPWVLSGGQADVGLAILADGQRGFPSVSGKVDANADQRGVLVIAEQTNVAGVSAIADANGNFTLFNVAPGTWTVRAYSRGVNYTPVDATVEAGKNVTGLELKRSDAPTATVSGSISVVAGSGVTSIVLVPASTFNENLARGEVPPGLRAPNPGTAPNIEGAFSIDGVPDGVYKVLAAFENDGLVRDPDPGIAGTTIQTVTVSGGTPSALDVFKITSAIHMVGPGGGDTVEDVEGTPTFTFTAYSSAKTYNVALFDTFGTKKWEATSLVLATSGDLSVAYTGDALTPGAIYQWRATAYGQAGNPISQTEDLKGVFRVK